MNKTNTYGYVDGIQCRRIEAYALDTPDAMPATGYDLSDFGGSEWIIGVGSTLWCADTGKKWRVFDITGDTITWCDESDTTSQETATILLGDDAPIVGVGKVDFMII